MDAPSAEPWVPRRAPLDGLAEAAQSCRGCELYRDATQTVFGEGPSTAKVVMIGEQPGDHEDLAGAPFVGPAGRLLDQALKDAEIDRSTVYVTNAVKHFKFQMRGKRRIHDKPSARELAACRPWLEAELDRIRPEVLVCLGATAAKAIFGGAYRVTKQRGSFIEHPWARHAMSTFHPSAVLRAPDDDSREQLYRDFVEDLKKVKSRMRTS
jgi:DNA polymerase